MEINRVMKRRNGVINGVITLFLVLVVMPAVGWAEGWPTVPAVKEHPPHGEWPTSTNKNDMKETPCYTEMQEARQVSQQANGKSAHVQRGYVHPGASTTAAPKQTAKNHKPRNGPVHGYHSDARGK